MRVSMKIRTIARSRRFSKAALPHAFDQGAQFVVGEDVLKQPGT